MLKPRTRTLCLGVAALLLGTAAITGTTSSGGTVTASAVVNAPVIRIASPFDGRVVEAPPARGVAVRPGDTLVRVEATEHDGGPLADFRSKLAAAEHQLAAVNGHAKALTAARGELKARMESYRAGAIARLAAQLKEAEALHNIFKARMAQSGEALDRQQQLKARGYASQANFDAATASANIARNDVAASAARIERIRVELDTARKGVFVDGRDDVPYSQQRDDEIMLRLLDLTARSRTLQATIHDLQVQIAVESKRVAAVDIFRQTASVAGLVWDTASPMGAPVRAGDPLVNLLDCSRPYLEVALDEKATAGIHAGDRARVRVPGVDAALEATVRGLRGASVPTGTSNIDVSADAAQGQVIVLVDLPNATDAVSMQAFCNVGRVAEVTFDGAPRNATASAPTRGPRKPAPVANSEPVAKHVRTARN
jgi:multidrug resistance efflux pump